MHDLATLRAIEEVATNKIRTFLYQEFGLQNRAALHTIKAGSLAAIKTGEKKYPEDWS